MPESLSAVTCGKYVRAEKPPVSTSILRRSESVKGTGRSSDSFLFQRLPALGASGKRLPELVAEAVSLPGNLQQRELLPILTAFPFNPLPRMDGGMGNLCRDKGNINFLAQRSTGSENSRPGRRRFRKREVWPAGEQASGSCGFRGRERRCVAVFSLSLRVIEYGG